MSTGIWPLFMHEQNTKVIGTALYLGRYGTTNVYFPPVSNDLICDIIPGNTQLEQIRNTGIYGYRFKPNATNDISFMVQLSHRWKEGSTVTPHIHWCPSNSNTNPIVFTLKYWCVDIGDVIPEMGTSLQTTITPEGGSYRNTISYFDAVPLAGKKASSIFGGTLSRSGGTGGDSFTGDVLVLGIDLHVLDNRLGEELT